MCQKGNAYMQCSALVRHQNLDVTKCIIYYLRANSELIRSVSETLTSIALLYPALW